MKGGTFTLVLVAGLTPIIVFALLVVGPTLGLVRWQPPVLWTTQFGVPGICEGTGYGNEVTAISTSTTGLYAVGNVGQSPCNLDSSTNYLFLNRYDFNGNQVWSKQLPGTSGGHTNSINAISVGSSSVFIAGSINGSGFVQRDDLNGNEVWTRQSEGQDISVGSGEVLAGGGSDLPSGGNKLLAYDSDGNKVWSKTLVNVTTSTIYAGSGGLYVAGFDALHPADTQAFVSKYDPNGTLLWTQGFDESGFTCSCYPNGLSGDSSGTYVSGSIFVPFPGNSPTFVRKYELNGNLLWRVQSDNPDLSDAGRTLVSVDPTGIYLLEPRFVIRYDANGNHVWSVALKQVFLGAISVGADRIFVGGTDPDAGRAVITSLDQSSSLILFGVNPPFSFLLAGLLAASAIVSILWLRRNWRKRVRRPPSTYDARLKTRSEPSFPIRKPA